MTQPLSQAEGRDLIEAARTWLARVPASGKRERIALTEAMPQLLAKRDAAFLTWAADHLRWSQVLAELAEGACSKAAELAPAALLAMASELEEDRAWAEERDRTT